MAPYVPQEHSAQKLSVEPNGAPKDAFAVANMRHLLCRQRMVFMHNPP
jgi:hypothetical protein